MSSTAAVLFTRDLRVHDHPALEAATRDFKRVIPLFVIDDRLLASTNRTAFLLEALDDLRTSLGGGLVVRRGRPADVVAGFRPSAIYLTSDRGPFGLARERDLRAVAEVRAFAGTSIVEPQTVVPAGRDHYRVFTPYWRAWLAAERRPLAGPPISISLPPDVDPGPLPSRVELVAREPSPALPRGGESTGRARLDAFLESGLATYPETRDALAADRTSRLSPYLHLGCLSALEIETAVRARGGEDFLRQLCWRDFCLQLRAAFPRLDVDDYRSRGRVWHVDGDALAAWRDGRTGLPIVDAGMRQLSEEGWMPNRARMLSASHLVKDLGIDWRLGAAHFDDLLVDGDTASNAANWQWVAGTGTDTRPNRRFNPVRQARRFDPDGAYARRWVPELASLDARDVHEPWRLGSAALARLGYPAPLVERS